MGGAERGLRLTAYVPAFVAVCLACDVLARWCLATTRPGSPERARRANLLIRNWGTWLTSLTVRLLGVRVDVRGTVPEGRFVVVSNHQSTADIAILISVLRPLHCKFVAKEELGRGKPFVSPSLRHFGSALVSHAGAREDVTRLREMALGLEAWNGSAVVFAEGTRSRDGRLLPYKKAGVRILSEATRLPLLPVAIDGTHVASDLPGFARGMPGARFVITIGAPVPAERWDGRLDDAVDDVRAWTEATIATPQGDV